MDRQIPSQDRIWLLQRIMRTNGSPQNGTVLNQARRSVSSVAEHDALRSSRDVRLPMQRVWRCAVIDFHGAHRGRRGGKGSWGAAAKDHAVALIESRRRLQRLKDRSWTSARCACADPRCAGRNGHAVSVQALFYRHEQFDQTSPSRWLSSPICHP